MMNVIVAGIKVNMLVKLVPAIFHGLFITNNV